MTVNSTLVDPYGRSSEDRAALREKIDMVNKDARENWDNPTWRREMAQEMTETIYEGFEHENLLSLMSEVENAPFDGRVFIKEVRGLRAFWVARGGYIEESTLKAEVMELPRDTIGFHVSEFEDKLRTNFAETQATLIELGIQRMDAEVNLRVLRLFQAAIPTTSPYYSSGSGLSLAGLNTAMREVRDESKSFEISIIGRSTMTDQIIDELLGNASNGAGYIPETNEQMVRRGVLGTYRGARIITLKNHKDDQEVPFFPANELYVAARDASKFAFWGGLMSKEYTENDNWYWHYLARRDFGGVVHRPERIRRIVDTSIAP
jgi:hypothetical protein